MVWRPLQGGAASVASETLVCDNDRIRLRIRNHLWGDNLYVPYHPLRLLTSSPTLLEKRRAAGQQT